MVEAIKCVKLMWRRCADSMGLHRVENASHTSPAVSLHLYSPPFQSCRSFDLRTGMARTVRTTFWSKNGRRTSPADISGTGAQQRRQQVSYRPLIILCCYQFYVCISSILLSLFRATISAVCCYALLIYYGLPYSIWQAVL